MTKQNKYYFFEIVIVLIFLFLAILFVVFKRKNNSYEFFGTFSPFSEINTYPWVYEKHMDQEKLRDTLRKWEKPFNNNNEGYYNAEPFGKPPLVPIYSYTPMKEVEFTYIPKNTNV